MNSLPAKASNTWETDKNDTNVEIKARIGAGKRCLFAVQKNSAF
jgi:hypothetical protein